MKNKFNYLIGFSLLFMALLFLNGCEADDPQREDVPELITKAIITFAPEGSAGIVTVTATDPDGEGVQDIQVDGSIDLVAGTQYSMTINLVNELAEPSTAEYNITEEVEEESDEHMFFFSWTNNVFTDPSGNGNIDHRGDAVNYNDQDGNGQPLGLLTTWTTTSSSGGVQSGEFRIVLKHQPGLKSATSGASDGETDLDITFVVNVN